MLLHYLTVGFRALTKHRAFAVINVLGLAIGMGGLPADPALRPLRDAVRPVAAACRRYLPAPGLV